MSHVFPAELQRLIQNELAKGIYASEEEVLLHAMRALREREDALQQWRAEIRSRIESLDHGEGVELEDERALRAFAEGVKAEGRRTCEADRKSP